MGLFKKIASVVGGAAAPLQILSSGSQIFGDYMAKEASKSAADKAYQQSLELSNQEYARQKEFAQMGLQWKVEDGRKAGLSPLAAIGGGGAGYSPGSTAVGVDNSTAEFRQRLGQNIGRAISATSTFEDKLVKRLQIKSMDLDNQLKQKELLSTGPNFPSMDPYLQGQGDAGKGLGLDDGRVIDTPFRRTVSDPRNPAKEAGAIPDFQVARTKGGWAVVPGADMKQRIEDSPMEYQWLMRNALHTYKYPGGRKAFMNPITGNLIPYWKDSWTEKIKGARKRAQERFRRK